MSGYLNGRQLYMLWRKPLQAAYEPTWDSLTENQKILWEKLADKLTPELLAEF